MQTIVPAANTPEICVRTPSESLTAVREPAAPIENACVNPAAAFAAPIASSSCDARTGSWRRPANERAVRISSANETRNTPSAAGASSATSPNPGRGSVGRGRPLGIRPTTATPWPARSSAQETPIAPTTTTSAPGTRGTKKRNASSTASADGADRHRRAAYRAELAGVLGQPVERVAGADREAEQLSDLADHEHDRNAVDVADQHRPREVVGEPAEPQQAREQEAGADEQREHRRELDRVRAAGDRERQHRGRDDGRDRSLRADDEHTRRAEQHVRERGHEQRVEAVHRREAGELAVGHRRRDAERRHRHPGDEVAAGARHAVARQVGGERQRAREQRLGPRRPERRPVAVRGRASALGGGVRSLFLVAVACHRRPPETDPLRCAARAASADATAAVAAALALDERRKVKVDRERGVVLPRGGFR